MNECQTASFHDSNCFRRETDYMDAESKEIYVLNDSSRDIGPPPSEAYGRAECWSAKVMDEFPLNNENLMVDSQRNSGQNAPSSREKDEDSLLPFTYDKDSEWKRCEEQECLTAVEEYNTHKRSGLSNSSFSPSVQMAVDEHIVDCNLPELEVCYKEINPQTVKDICIDEGRHEDRILVGSVETDMSETIEASLLKNVNDPSADQCAPKELVICEETCRTTDNVATATDSLEDGSLMVSKLPIQDLDAQSSLDSEVKGVEQSLHQIPNRREVSEEDACAGGLLDNTKVESGSSSSNLDSPVQFIAGITNGTIVNTIDGNSDGSPVAPCVNGKDESNEMVHEQSNNKDRDGKSAHLSGPQTVEPNEHRNFDNASFVSQLENDKGETSFSAASLIAYSGPMVASGNISNRSDSSTTSARSFAFPILQSEWNSSPVRMAKADRRQLRKHKGWLSVSRCCGF